MKTSSPENYSNIKLYRQSGFNSLHTDCYRLIIAYVGVEKINCSTSKSKSRILINKHGIVTRYQLFSNPQSLTLSGNTPTKKCQDNKAVSACTYIKIDSLNVFCKCYFTAFILILLFFH